MIWSDVIRNHTLRYDTIRYDTLVRSALNLYGAIGDRFQRTGSHPRWVLWRFEEGGRRWSRSRREKEKEKERKKVSGLVIHFFIFFNSFFLVAALIRSNPFCLDKLSKRKGVLSVCHLKLGHCFVRVSSLLWTPLFVDSHVCTLFISVMKRVYPLRFIAWDELLVWFYSRHDPKTLRPFNVQPSNFQRRPGFEPTLVLLYLFSFSCSYWLLLFFSSWITSASPSLFSHFFL